MKNSKRKTVSLVIVMGMILGLFAGCDSTETVTSSDASNITDDASASANDVNNAEKKDDIIIAMAEEPSSLDSIDHSSQASAYMNYQTYDSLFVTNAELGVEAHLVDSYEMTSDTEWIFTLKQGVKFHNGETMTAYDVVASYDRAADSAQTVQTLQYIDSYEAVDDYTLKIITTTPYANLPYDLSHYHLSILPKSLIDDEHDFGREPIGTGPYKFVEQTLGEKVVFEAFDEYFDGAPAIKEMTWKVIPEAASRSIMLQTGEIDAAVDISESMLKKLDEENEVELYSTISTEQHFITLNNEVAPFDNQDFRLGLNYAINREDIVTVILGDNGVIANTQTPVGLPGTSTENAYTYDPTKAEEYFTLWGGELSTIEIPIVCYGNEARSVAEIIQANLGVYGITVTIESLDYAAYLSVISEGDYSAAIGSHTANTNYDYSRSVWHSDSIGGSNKSMTNDPEIDRLIELAGETFDEEEKVAILEELSVYLNENAGQVPLYQQTIYLGNVSGLVGFECNSLGWIDFDKMYWE